MIIKKRHITKNKEKEHNKFNNEKSKQLKSNKNLMNKTSQNVQLVAQLIFAALLQQNEGLMQLCLEYLEQKESANLNAKIQIVNIGGKYEKM